MNALCLSFFAASCAALSSLFVRKNGDNPQATSSSSVHYLMIYYLSSLLFACLLYPDVWTAKVNYIILAIGAAVGVLNSILMLFIANALQRGPAGLTFAFLNASAIFPGFILFILLGAPFGFTYSYIQFIGILLALFGLFLGAHKKGDERPKSYFTWLKYTLAFFAFQIVALTLIQARCVLFNCQQLGGVFATFAVTERDDIWFMPGQFAASALLQLIFYLKERQKFQKHEMVYGFLGGMTNFSCTCLLLLATKFALPFEKGILFPCFAITCMVLCNFWANRLYKEPFNFKTNCLCSCGILMAAS